MPALLRYCMIMLLAATTASCTSLSGRDPLRVDLAGIEPLPGEGLEVRFALKLRVQNPNDSAVDYDGVALALEINERPLAYGVSDQRGQVPRFGETLIRVPVSISAFAMMRQALGATDHPGGQSLPYELTGKLGSGLLGTRRFSASGTLDWPQPSVP